MVIGIAIWIRIGTSEHGWAGGPGQVGDGASTSGVRAADISAGAVQAHKAQATGLPHGDAEVSASHTRAIESWLATLPREPVVVRVGTRADVARLEDRIAQVDDLLTSVRLDGGRPDSLAALQRERIRLVGSLAQVRYAEVLAAQSP